MTDRPDDVVDLLQEQHARIDQFFLTALTAQGQPRHDAFVDLVRLLSLHETVEEEIVHPIARDVLPPRPDEGVDLLLEEEHRIRRHLIELTTAGADAPDFVDRLRALREAVLTHVRREERDEFPRLRRDAGQRLRGLADAVRAAEAVIPARPHPDVAYATTNVLVGLPTAIADLVRGTVRAATGT